METDAFADCVANIAAQDVDELADLDDLDGDGDERERSVRVYDDAVVVVHAGRDAQRAGRSAHYDDVHPAVEALRERHVDVTGRDRRLSRLRLLQSRHVLAKEYIINKIIRLSTFVWSCAIRIASERHTRCAPE